LRHRLKLVCQAQFIETPCGQYDGIHFNRVKLGGDFQGRNVFNDSGFGEDGQRGQAFVDERLSRDFVPFSVQAIGSDILVTYALHQEGSLFETESCWILWISIRRPADCWVVLSIAPG
jgi:hypothetical protein